MEDAFMFEFEDELEALQSLDNVTEQSVSPQRKRRRIEHAEKEFCQPKPTPKTKAEYNFEVVSSQDEDVQSLDKENVSNGDIERQKVFRRMPAGAFFHVTGEDGSRAYMQLKSQDAVKDEVAKKFSTSNSLQLLGLPLELLKQYVREERRRKMMNDLKVLEELPQDSEFDQGDSSVAPVDEDEEVEPEDDHTLWVERYSPNGYRDLLSDEATNRTLLKWLKLWDFVVFDKQPKKKNPDAKGKKNQEQNKKFFKNNLEVNEELDQHNRPAHKIALLSGPPGLGKTTLAHVIARHAGYNVVGMNASDDRSPEIFQQKIEAATQMKAVLGADPRPNCLIIDEIDGAPQPAINMLLRICINSEKQSSSKKKKKDSLLLRPIICICNDLYVPALRQLRQNSFVVTFPPTVSVKLAGRLMEISRLERIKADMTTLLALCEKADNDIRSCLNTLQFVKSKSAQLTLQTVHSMKLGQKDAHKSLFFVWQQIFTMPRPKRKRYINPHDRASVVDDAEQLELAISNNNTSPSARFHNTLQMAYAAGESQKVLQGLHENYLESKAKDPRMEGVLMAVEWMEFIDILTKEVNRTQNYSLARYNPYLCVVFHLLFAANNPQKVTYPHSQYEFTNKTSHTENLVTAMMNDVAPSVHRNLNLLVTVTEVLPPLLAIMQPVLRPVNTQLYSAREKEDLAQLVRTMIAYNMTYHQQRSVEGQYNYVLDPNMDEVSQFPGQRHNRQLTYSAKQLIAREIDLEKMRHSEASLGSRHREERRAAKPSKPEVVDPSKAKEIPNHLRQKLESKPVVVAEHHAVDFFGRRIQNNPPVVNENQVPKKQKPKQEIIGGDIWFRFKEGFTNAVRKTVRVQDLI